MLTAEAQGALRLRTVSLEERSRLRFVNGASAGRSLEAIEPKNFYPDVKNKYPILFENRLQFDAKSVPILF